MRTIYKYRIEPGQKMMMLPENAIPLYVAEQHGDLCLWADVDTNNRAVQRAIHVVGTGHDLSDAKTPRSYIGTAICGRFVWHVFDGG